MRTGTWRCRDFSDQSRCSRIEMGAAWAKLLLRRRGSARRSREHPAFRRSGALEPERGLASLTAEVNGIGGGFQGVGTKTVLPQKAFAKLTFRLVPQQRPDDVMAKVKAYLRGKCPPGVCLEISGGHAGEPYLTDPNSADGQAAQHALRRAFPGREVALIREGGSIPIVNTFKKGSVWARCFLGLAPAWIEHAHAPDENFPPLISSAASGSIGRCSRNWRDLLKRLSLFTSQRYSAAYKAAPWQATISAPRCESLPLVFCGFPFGYAFIRSIWA